MSTANYQTHSKAELIAELEQLKNRKKFGLVWEEKIEEVAERCKIDVPVLREVKSRAIATDLAKPVNLLIEGDNYHALSVLNYTHSGKIDVIYIDPPYNTGAKDWKYNNNYVDVEDAFRHSKWLSMMHKRLVLAKHLMSDKGFICVTIDHHELFSLGCLMDDVFGEENRLGVVSVLMNPRGRQFSNFFSVSIEFYLVYAKNKKQTNFNKIAIDDNIKNTFTEKDSNGRYVWRNFVRSANIEEKLKNQSTDYCYPIYVSKDFCKLTLKYETGYRKVLPKENREMKCWQLKKSTFAQRLASDATQYQAFDDDGEIVIKKKYREQQFFMTHWIGKKYNSTFFGTRLLEKIIGEGKFHYPKSLYAVIDFLKITSNKDSIILDFFAGSGTTGHAVLQLNQEDGGNRRFILCTNNENQIAERATYPRIKKVIKGYRENGDGEAVGGLGGNLKYYKTAFVASGENDFAKKKLTDQATEMLCIKENTFDEVKITQKYKIFRNCKKHMAIIFTDSAIENCKKAIEKIDGHCTVYIFSLGSDADADEFDNLRDRVAIEAVPNAILRIYHRIFK